MKGFNKVFRVVLCMSVLAVTLSVPATRAAGPPSGLDVNVVNTSSNPVPVTLQGAGTVSGSVAITNTPNVNVANTRPSTSLERCRPRRAFRQGRSACSSPDFRNRRPSQARTPQGPATPSPASQWPTPPAFLRGSFR